MYTFLMKTFFKICKMDKKKMSKMEKLKKVFAKKTYKNFLKHNVGKKIYEKKTFVTEKKNVHFLLSSTGFFRYHWMVTKNPKKSHFVKIVE